MIGRWIDHAVDSLIVGAGTVANRLLEQCAPTPGDRLADLESQYEVFEPLGEYPEVPTRRDVDRRARDGSARLHRIIAVDAVCEILAEHHPNSLPSNGEVRCCCDDYLADRQDWRDHVAPLIVDNLPNSAPGASFRSAPVVADAPSPAPPPRGAGSGHSTSELLLAAANQVTAFKRGITDHLLADYLDDLIPELRDRAAQFAAIQD